jgi:hypothetical protein
MKMLNAEPAGMQAERERFEVRLQEERQSANKGMELLLMAQEKLSHMLSSAVENSKNSSGKGHGAHQGVATVNSSKPVQTAAAVCEAKSDAAAVNEAMRIKWRQAGSATSMYATAAADLPVAKKKHTGLNSD